LPEAFGGWSKAYKRFNAWSASGKWLKVLQALVAEPDMEWVFIDGSYAKATASTVLGLPAVWIRQSGKAGQATPARFTWL